MHSLLKQFVRLFLVLTLSVLPFNAMADAPVSDNVSGCHAGMQHSTQAKHDGSEQPAHDCCYQQCDQDCSGCTVTSGIISFVIFQFSDRVADQYRITSEQLFSRSSPPHTPPPLALII